MTPIATEAGDRTLDWVSLYKEAGGEYQIRPSILAAQVYLESRGRPGQVSSAQAQGITQFIPSTAAAYNVNTAPGGERSQVFGAARYLTDLGFHKDERKAIASYAAGPGNYQAGLPYADRLLTLARTRFAALDRTSSPGAVTTSSPALDLQPGPAASPGGEFLTREKQSQALYALLWVIAIAAGAAATVYGLSRATGVRNPLTAVAKKAPGVPG